MIKLFESYVSQKELEYLTKLILTNISESTLNKLTHNGQHINYFESTKIGIINPNVFNELKSFVKSYGDLTIHIIEKSDVENYDMKGDGSFIVDGKGNKYIFILIGKFAIKPNEERYIIKRVNEYKEKWDYDNTQDIVDNISYLLFREYGSTLLHELQHAYDEFRSEGKALNKINLNGSEYDKLSSKGIENLKDEERELMGKYFKQYLNLKYEVDARFTQAIQKIDFYDWDFDKSIDENKDIFVMHPFKDIFKNFKRKMYGYKFLSDKDKKRLQRTLGKFYELEREFVIKHNKESIDYDIKKK